MYVLLREPEVDCRGLWHDRAPSEFSLDANVDGGQQAGGDVIVRGISERRRPVRHYADHAVDAAAEAGPGSERTDPKDPGGRRV